MSSPPRRFLRLCAAITALALLTTSCSIDAAGVLGGEAQRAELGPVIDRGAREPAATTAPVNSASEVSPLANSLEPVICPIEVASFGVNSWCGEFRPVESRRSLGGNLVALPITLFAPGLGAESTEDDARRAIAAAGDDLVLMLDPAPLLGVDSVDDVIDPETTTLVMTVRGGFGARPNTTCSEPFDGNVELLEVCIDRLEEGGVDTSSYGITSIVADARDLRSTLSVSGWHIVVQNLNGIQAADMIETFGAIDPQGVRSITMRDPAARVTDRGSTADERLARFFEGAVIECERDASCAARFPNVERDIASLIETARTNPLATNPFTAETFDEPQPLDDDGPWTVASGTFTSNSWSMLPYVAERSAAGQTALLEQISTNWGVAWTPNGLSRYCRFEPTIGLCSTESAADFVAREVAETEAVLDHYQTDASPPPSLVLAGRYDPSNDPVELARLDDLDHALVAVRPGVHSQLDDCDFELEAAFRAGQRELLDCVDDGDAFITEVSTEVSFEPTEHTFDWVEPPVVVDTLLPTGWTGDDRWVYLEREAHPLDPASLWLDVFTDVGSVDEAISWAVADPAFANTAAVDVSVRARNGSEWTVHTATARATTKVIAVLPIEHPTGFSAVVVVLDALYDESAFDDILVPVLESIDVTLS